jgi:hypothetical protein
MEVLMWWVKVLALLLLAGSVVALFQGLTSMVKGESADGSTARALGWRIALSALAFLFLVLSMYMGWIEPHDVRYTERGGVPIEQSSGP